MGNSIVKRIDEDILADLELCREFIGVTSINKVLAFAMPVIKKACMMQKARIADELLSKLREE